MYLIITILLIRTTINALSLTGLAAILTASAIALLAATIPAAVQFNKRGSRNVRRALYVVSGLSIVWLFWGWVASIIVEVAHFLAHAVGAHVFAELVPAVAFIISLLIFATTVYGIMRARQLPKITEVDIPISGLPEHLEGITIVQLSDLHIGPVYSAHHLRRIIRKVNALNPDLIVLTGDQADGDFNEFRRNISPLHDLSARLGVFACNGNHDHYAGADRVVHELAALNVTTLVNAWREVMPDLIIAGIDDPSHSTKAPIREDLDTTLANIPKAGAVILLAHQPHVFPQAAEAGVDLVLSGHTHGGQIVPWNLVVRRFYPNDRGYYRNGKSSLYVSRGVGTWGPPMRIGAPAELPVFTLKHAPVTEDAFKETVVATSVSKIASG